MIYADDITLYESFSVHDINTPKSHYHDYTLRLKKQELNNYRLNVNKLPINIPKSKYGFHVPQRLLSLENEYVTITNIE